MIVSFAHQIADLERTIAVAEIGQDQDIIHLSFSTSRSHLLPCLVNIATHTTF